MNPREHRGLVLLIAALAMIGPFAIDTFFPAFPAIAAEFAASPVAMQQTLSLYLIAYGLMALAHGALSDALGRRPVIIVSLSVFTVASLACALAQSMEQLLALRFVQGLSAGAGVIVGRAIVRDCFEGARAQRVMSTTSMLFGIAPAVAPIVGGYLLHFGWRASFWFLAAFSLALVIASARTLPETLPAARRIPIAPLALLRGYLTMLRDGRFVLLSFAAGFNFSAIFLYISSAPAFVLAILGLGELEFAYFFVPTIGGMMIGAWLSGRFAGRLAPRRAVAIAYGLMAIAAVVNLAYSLAADVQWPWAVIPVGLTALGVAIAFPLLSLALMDRFPERRGSASSLQMALSLSVNAAVAGVLAPLVQTADHHLALAAALLTAVGFLLYLPARSSLASKP